MRALSTFFLLTFALTWSAWYLASMVPPDSASAAWAPVRQTFVLIGTFAPAIVGLALTARARGPGGVRALVARIGRWRVGARWYLFAILYMPAVKLLVAMIHRIATGAWPRFGETPWFIMALAIVTSAWAQAGEEIGWRGYALPRLAERLGLGGAALVLGVVWAAWHLPLFYIIGGDKLGQSFPLYVLQVTALSVAVALLYWRTSGSLLLVMLMHAAMNNTTGMVPSPAPVPGNPMSIGGTLVFRLTIVVLWIPAAYFLVRMRAADISTLRPGEPDAAGRFMKGSALSRAAD